MDLSIIIVSWQVKELLRKNLSSIFASVTNYRFEVIVVDNNSSDDSVKMIKSHFPQVKIIANQKNLGFAKACNQGIRKAKGDYILLLNPDMQLFTDTIENSLIYAKGNKEATVVGIKLIDQQGNIVKQVRRFPRLFDQLIIILKISHIFPFVLNSYLNKNFNYNQAQVVDSIRGSYFLINKKNWQNISQEDSPLLDETYFIWFEEVDFCRQVYKNKGKVFYCPHATACDLVGSSFKKVNWTLKQNYFRDSMLTYFKKWQPQYQYYILKIAWKIVLNIAKVLKK
jgi:GT2 family glycosyltransferase